MVGGGGGGGGSPAVALGISPLSLASGLVCRPPLPVPTHPRPYPHPLPYPALPAAWQLKALGVGDVLGFDFMDPPPRAALLRSLELLLALGALDPARGDLTTPTGGWVRRSGGGGRGVWGASLVRLGCGASTC